MIEKKLVFLFALLFALPFFTEVGSASDACPSGDLNDIILRLAAPTNAHAETESSTNYHIPICFLDLFTSEAVAPPRASCDGSNTVLKLASQTNAHAEGPTGTNYPIDVCYEGFSCNVQTNGCSTGTEILRLSSLTNAHLETIAGTGGYTNSLCCTFNGAGGGGGSGNKAKPLWLDSSGDEITTARVGDTIYPTLTNYDGSAGTDFDIEEEDSGLNPDDQILIATGSQDLVGNWSYAWTIQKAQITPPVTSDYDNFTFQISNNISKQLEITFCGDGKIIGQETWEQCDDGNSDDGDSCSNSCQINYGAGDRVWFDLSGNPISTANLGDTVIMNYIGQELLNTDPDFNIKERDPFGDPNDNVAVINGYPENGDFIGNWTIPDDQVGAEEEDVYDAFFRIEGGNSQSLLISSGTGGDKTTGDILDPLCGTDLVEGTQQDILFQVLDSDSTVDITLRIDGNVVFTRDDVQGGNFSYSHTFDTSGTTSIVLSAESSDGDKVKSTSNVIVYDPSVDDVDYVAACIQSPKDYSNINADYTFFDASNTRAINYDSNNNPAITNYPFSSLDFTWSFSDGRSPPNPDGASTIAYKFYKYFSNFGDNSATLRVDMKSP